MLKHLLAGAACALAMSAASAGTYASIAFYTASNPNPASFVGSHPLGLNLSGTNAQGSATGTADLGLGLLAASVEPGQNSFVNVRPQLSDVVTFAGAAGVGYLDWHVEAAQEPSGGFEARVNFFVSPYGPGSHSSQEVVVSGTCQPEGAPCAHDRQGSLAFQILPGSTYISSDMSFYVGGSPASVTSQFSLRLPDGVTFTSNSGQSFTGVSSIPAVPEPDSAMLIGIGLAAGGLFKAYRTRLARQSAGV